MPILVIIVMATIGALTNGFSGFIISGVITTIALLALGKILRTTHPAPFIELIDQESQIYSVTNNIKVQPYIRDGNLLTFRLFKGNQTTLLTINIEKGIFSIDTLIGSNNSGGTIERQNYKNNETIRAIAEYFSNKKDVWLS